MSSQHSPLSRSPSTSHSRHNHSHAAIHPLPSPPYNQPPAAPTTTHLNVALSKDQPSHRDSQSTLFDYNTTTGHTSSTTATAPHSRYERLSDTLHQLWLFVTFQLILSPNNRYKVCWDWFLLLSILYNTLALPFIIAFAPSFAQSALVLSLDVVTTVLMATDMALMLRVAVSDHSGQLVYDSAIIRLRYTHSRAFVIDCISTFPFFRLRLHRRHRQLPRAHEQRAQAAVRTAHLSACSAHSAYRTVPAHPSCVSYAFYCGSSILAHCFGCGFWMIGQLQPDGSVLNWTTVHQLSDKSFVTQYIVSLYWALETMCTVGFGDNLPVTTYEIAYVSFVLMATGVIYAAVFGNMSEAIHALSTSVRRYHGILDGVKEFSSIYMLPPPLAAKLLRYAQANWDTTKGFSMDDVLSIVPLSVHSEVLSHINHSLVMRVPLFRECHPRFLDAIITKLHNMVCLGGDYVFREGDMSRDMYFIKHGTVEVVQDDPTAIGEQEVVIATIGADSSHPFLR